MEYRCLRACLLSTPRSFFNWLKIKSQAAVNCRACAVSTTSVEVRPKWMKREEGPTFSATEVRNEIKSWLVLASMASILLTENLALFLMTDRSFAGIFPKRAQASQAATSTRNHDSNLDCSDQRAPISGKV